MLSVKLRTTLPIPRFGVFWSWKNIEFCKMFFFCLHGDNCIVFFPLYSIKMVYHIDWFLYVYPTLHFWDNHHFGHGTKPCLCVVLLAFCCGFLHLYLWSIVPQFAFLSISLSRFDISMFIGLLVWIEKFVFLFFFLEEFVKDWC